MPHDWRWIYAARLDWLLYGWISLWIEGWSFARQQECLKVIVPRRQKRAEANRVVELERQIIINCWVWSCLSAVASRKLQQRDGVEGFLLSSYQLLARVVVHTPRVLLDAYILSRVVNNVVHAWFEFILTVDLSGSLDLLDQLLFLLKLRSLSTFGNQHVYS